MSLAELVKICGVCMGAKCAVCRFVILGFKADQGDNFRLASGKNGLFC
jgi:hypothetical protein